MKQRNYVKKNMDRFNRPVVHKNKKSYSRKGKAKFNAKTVDVSY